MRVLVIDDDASIRSMLDLVLGLEGFEVHFATDGRQGLEAAQELQPDVLVLDIMMPEMDGRDVARELALDPRTAGTPVVFCSALADAEDIWAGWRAGAASYVPKPFDNDRLICELLRVTRATTRDHDSTAALTPTAG